MYFGICIDQLCICDGNMCYTKLILSNTLHCLFYLLQVDGYNVICHELYYDCSIRDCIPLDYLCDYRMDCKDGADEMSCTSVHHHEIKLGSNHQKETVSKVDLMILNINSNCEILSSQRLLIISEDHNVGTFFSIYR